MFLILQSKDIVGQAELKSKIQQFVAYKKHISLTQTNIGLGWQNGKKIFRANTPKSREE
jgi:hypothetical protein